MQYVHLSMTREHLHTMVDVMKERFAESETASLIDYGISSKCIAGYIVLAWESEVEETVLAELLQQQDVLDLCVFTDPCKTDDVFSPLLFL